MRKSIAEAGGARTGIHLFIADWPMNSDTIPRSMILFDFVALPACHPRCPSFLLVLPHATSFVCAKGAETMSQATTFWRLAGMTYLEVRKSKDEQLLAVASANASNRDDSREQVVSAHHRRPRTRRLSQTPHVFRAWGPLLERRSLLRITWKWYRNRTSLYALALSACQSPENRCNSARIPTSSTRSSPAAPPDLSPVFGGKRRHPLLG